VGGYVRKDIAPVISQRLKRRINMDNEKRFLVDVGMSNLPFPMKVASRNNKDGQQTVADISIQARIMHEFEARWIDKFIQILHNHRDRIGTSSLKTNILDYLKELEANAVTIDFEYPFFYEKLTPVSKEKCLVRYKCRYSVKMSVANETPKATFQIKIPIITTYPLSNKENKGGVFGQLSSIDVEVESDSEIYPEDIIEIVDRHALMPVYSFLTEKDQEYVISVIHSKVKTSVEVIDEIKNEIAKNKKIDWYSVKATNFGMLHSYSTVIGTEKSMWVPFSD
jgi:GTP cyclohydrolase IB